MHALTFELDRSAHVPAYIQLASALERAVATGAIPVGSSLGTEPELIRSTGLSRSTVKRAVEILVRKGLATRRRGIGTTVCARTSPSRPPAIGFWEEIRRSGRSVGTRVLERDVRPADAQDAVRLRVPPGSPVLRLRRLRSVDAEPVAVIDSVLPSELVALSVRELETEGLFALLARRGAPVHTILQRITVAELTPLEAGHLALASGRAAVEVTRAATDARGDVLSWSRTLERPGTREFAMTLTAHG